MSIPPLVCSTPPPPDQCEDDKDPGDFDLSYSLSQEDDDDENNDYSYGNFSTFNNYQSDIKPSELEDQQVTNNIDTGVHKEIFMEYEHSNETEQSNIIRDEFEANDISENKFKCEEDMNIEDLNLKLDEEIVTNIVENNDENEISDQNTDCLKDLNIPCNSNSSSQDDDNTNASLENVIESIADIKESHIDTNEIIGEQPSDVNTKHDTKAEDVDLSPFEGNISKSPININELLKGESSLDNIEDIPEKIQSVKEFESEPSENVADDDFGDFDDFQFASTGSNVASVVDSSNPWGSSNEATEEDFGNFTANFEESKPQNPVTSHSEDESPTSDQVKENDDFKDDDDDFGDFDDFQSSTVKTASSEAQEEDTCQEMSVLNLQSSDNENHIMESVTKVLTSVFIEEISEPDEEFEGKLESLLSETWGHLMETDERQPYIVNWNNSLGQKTLLKALCIDSRNILFGPKWSSHMPKYAANLSVAPLQPQKQASSTSNVSQSEVVAEKTSSKPTAWSDPFTADGQEFTYAEALLLDLEHLMATLDQMAHNHSTLKISELLSHACNTEHESSAITPRPTDLDVFEAAMSSKPEKIYSSTLNVQPIRQISLPDTHIFTPTDSEIPRSKTIHYDAGPTVLMPQPVVADDKNLTNNPLTSNLNSGTSPNTTEDSEYWEFQDFKGTSNSNPAPDLTSQHGVSEEKNFETARTVNALPKPSIAYQTQLLQPIKVEPSMPTLNWPAPGEVKATYDDFTDFVSISSQSTETRDSAKIHMPESENQISIETSSNNNLHDFNVKTDEAPEVIKQESDGFDDEFDTFKSALPSKNVQKDLKTNSFGNSFTQMPSRQPADSKSESISFATMPTAKEALTQQMSFSSNPSDLGSSSMQTQSRILQPMSTNFSSVNTQNQRTTGQILQPLSLESYSQINWPSPGIDLQDLSRFNPVETLQSLKSDLSMGSASKVASPVHTQKNTVMNQSDDDVWGDFVSSKPKQQPSAPKKPLVFAEDDEWTDFISSPSVKPQNGLNTISLNVHTNSNIHKTEQNKFSIKNNQTPVDIPTLNYITPKSNPHKTYNDKHFQNL
nr:uncharacterized protein LOC110373411 isoform X1 [Helicoverpa armigera]